MSIQVPDRLTASRGDFMVSLSLISGKTENPNEKYFKLSINTDKKSNKTSNDKKKTISYNPAKYMKKIASANSIMQLSAIKGNLYAQISAIKHSGASEEKILLITGKMQNAIRKIDTKINHLTLENKMEKKKEAAKIKKEKTEKEKAKRIDKALKQRRLNRKAKEYNDIYEAEKEGITSIEVRENYGFDNETGYTTSDFNFEGSITDTDIGVCETSSVDLTL